MINLVRCDDRLIHGQCMTRIVQHYFIKEILVVDEFTATNPIMKMVFEKVVPPSMKAYVFTVQQSISKILEAMTNEVGTLILFRSPLVYKNLLEMIPDLPKIVNIGPVAKRNGSQEVNTGTYLTSEDFQVLDWLNQHGVELFFQVVPDQKKFGWEEAKKKYKL